MRRNHIKLRVFLHLLLLVFNVTFTFAWQIVCHVLLNTPQFSLDLNLLRIFVSIRYFELFLFVNLSLHSGYGVLTAKLLLMSRDLLRIVVSMCIVS
jgi:hypothetical protein